VVKTVRALFRSLACDSPHVGTHIGTALDNDRLRVAMHSMASMYIQKSIFVKDRQHC